MRNHAVIVTGDRYAVSAMWRDVVRDALRESRWHGGDAVLIHGGAKGIDTIAGQVGPRCGWSVVPIPANWEAYGKSAGPMRNRAMLDVLRVLNNHGYEAEVLAFHDALDASKGTRHMVTLAMDSGFRVTSYTSRGRVGV